jgi:antitoxin (DNA-binding transcriptional repressor) of toxin-antitoxin stability system
MQQIEISEIQNQIGILLTAIHSGEEVIFTEAAQPIAKVIKLLPAGNNNVAMQRIHNSSSQILPIKKRRKAGSAAGQIFMAPDFDEPLDDFKEYME